MKVLFLGTYREPSGYGEAATEAALAIDAAGADLACRAFQLTPNGVANPKLAELERKSFGGSPDFTFQLAPPYLQRYVREGGVNVGSFYAETRPIPAPWAALAGQMDAQVVPCRLMEDVLRTSPRFRRPVYTVPVSCDPAVYRREYPAPPAVRDFCRGRFVFYTVGEFVRRKGFTQLLRAFLAEFSHADPVGLLVKTGLPGREADKVRERFQQEVAMVEQTTKSFRHAPVAVVSERLPREELFGLHQAAHCFVQPSFGESVGLPARDACFFGKTPIVTAAGGYLEYVDDACGYPVACRPVPVFDDCSVHAELFSGRAVWDEPDILALRAAMRRAFSDRAGREARAEVGRGRAAAFSRERIGGRLLEVFADVQASAAASGGRVVQPRGVPTSR